MSEAEAEAPQEKRKPDLKDAGQLWADLFGHDWAWDTTALVWRRWGHTHWRDLGTRHTELDQQAMQVLRVVQIPVSSPSTINGTIRAAAPVCSQPFPAVPGIVNFANGTLDVTPGTLRDHARRDHLTYCLPYAWAPGKHPAIAQFLADTIPDAAARHCYLIHCGLALLRDTRIHQMVLLIGPPRSGKSCLLALANAVCGQEPAAFAGPSLFGRDSEGLKTRASWGGKRLVAIDELPVEALQNESLVKIMSAHGGVEMRRMYSAQVLENQWVPKLLLNTNEAPRYADRSGALTVRLVPIRCPNSRADAPETQDAFLLDTLWPELPAFAATCLQAAQAFLAQRTGRYPLSPEMRAELIDIEQQGDALKSFLAEHCVITFDRADFVESGALYDAYRQACHEGGNAPLSNLKLVRALHDRYPRLITHVKHRLGDRTARCIEGLRWRQPSDDEPENVPDVPDVPSSVKPPYARVRAPIGGLLETGTSGTSGTFRNGHMPPCPHCGGEMYPGVLGEPVCPDHPDVY